MLDDIARQLKQTTLFSALKRNDLNAVARLVVRKHYPAGSVVCQQGEIGHTAYFVESGQLRVLHINPEGIEREVGQLGAGDYFGETSLLVGEPRDATVEVVPETVQVAEEAVLFCLHKEDFDHLIEERPLILDALQMRPDVEKKRYAPRFKWQDPSEVVIVHLHKHPVVLISHLIFPLFVLLLDVVGCGYWYLQTGASVALSVGVLLALIPLGFGAYLFLDHQNDDYIVTNRRIVHEEREFLIRERRAEAPLRAVQDIQQIQEGLWAQIFDLGDLIVETAGEHGVVVFRQIPNPAQVQEAIFEQMRRVQAMARAEERAAVRDVLRRHFDVSAPEEPAPEPEPLVPKGYSAPDLSQLLAPLRFLRYFWPPLRHEEEDAIIWHKHWIALIKPIALPTMLMGAVTITAIWLVSRTPGNLLPTLIAYGTVIAFLFPWWLWAFDDWKNDIYQVTSSRIIDIEQLPFSLREERREASLGAIQNINLEIPGFWGRLLNYGSVTIETAGVQAFTFDYVHDPRGVQADIFRRVEAFHQRLRQQEAERHQNELLDWFAAYDKMRRSEASTAQPPSLGQQEF